jgi:class 3 adenylate cyclase
MVQERPVRIERRLSAILAGDAAGYSRLMHTDEEATHAKLRTLLAEGVEPAIAEHGGRIVKNTGDGFLAEFPSAVEAVRAAIQFQTRIKELTIGEVDDRRIAFRVGVNIGDVIIEPHDIFGDGVNIAARLESIAEPGGICISSSAYDQVRGKVGVEFADLGEQDLKNIARPVRAYAVAWDGLGPVTKSGSTTPSPRPMWGTYWEWDARLTSVLILFLMYLSLIALWRAVEDPSRAARAAAILTLVGAINLPIIKFSVDWWNTLHQPASVMRIGGPTLDRAFLIPLLVMAVAFSLLFVTLHLAAMRNEILRRRVRALQLIQVAQASQCPA